MRRGTVRLVLAGALCLLAWLGTPAAPAHAHAELKSSDPPAGAKLKVLPDKMTLTFTGAVSGEFSQVRLGAVRLPVTQPAGHPAVLVADLTKAVPEPSGRVRLGWRVISLDDGHAIDGAVEYTVAAAGGSASPPKSPQAQSAQTQPSQAQSLSVQDRSSEPRLDPAVRYGYLIARGVGYVALALFLGGLVFVSVLWPAGSAVPRTRRVLVVGCGLGVLSSVAGACLQSVYAELRPLSDAIRPAVVGPLLSTHIGQVLAARVLLWLLAAIVLAWLLQRDRAAVTTHAWRVAAAAVGFGLVATTGMAGHAAETSVPVVSQLADLVHLVGMSTWIGGLALLLTSVLPRRRPEELAAVMPKYSTLALSSVVAITVAGTVLAWQLIGSAGSLFSSSYGRLLLVKLAIVVLVLAVAQRSKAWVTRRLRYAVVLGADRATVRPLMFSVMAETGLLLGVLAMAVLLVTANPGR